MFGDGYQTRIARSCNEVVSNRAGSGMKRPLALTATMLLSIGGYACGAADTGSKPTLPAGSSATTSGDQARTASGEAGRTIAAEPGLARRPYEIAGVAAGNVDRKAITALVKSYYAAVVADDGAEACSLLDRSLAKSVAEDYGSMANLPELRGKTCVQVMSALFRHRRGQPTSNVAGIAVTGVRVVSGTHAIALLRSPTMVVGETSAERTEGVWRMSQLLGSSLH